MFVQGDALGATATAAPAPLPGGLESGVVFSGKPQWVAFVKAHGGIVTRIPSGDLKGALAASYGGRYVLAPLDIRKQDDMEAAQLAKDIAAGAQADATLKLVKDTAATVGHAAESAVKGTIGTTADIVAAAGKGAGDVVASTLGIPHWLIPVLLLGVGAVVLKTVLPTLPGVVSSRYGRR